MCGVTYDVCIIILVCAYGKCMMCVFIQVESERTDLLKHPLVTSLLNQKWQRYGAWFYSINILVYVLFLIFLTAFALSIHSPLEDPCKSDKIIAPACMISKYSVLC